MCHPASLRFHYHHERPKLDLSCQYINVGLLLSYRVQRAHLVLIRPLTTLKMLTLQCNPYKFSTENTQRYIYLPYKVSGYHDDVIKWKHFPSYWPFVRGIHRSPVNSLHKGQWRGALIFSLIDTWVNSWVNNGEAGNLRRHRAHYYVIVTI